MFNKKSSRPSLALFVALTLGSGAFLAPSAADAADVSGQNVTIDDTHAPSNNATDPNNSSNVIGTAAGFIGNMSDSGNVTNNTLTFNGRPAPPYDKPLFGGLTFGTGNVTGNRIIVNPATGTLLSTADGIFGGLANGGGSVENNHAEFNGNQLNGDLVGGMTKDGGTGIVKGNTATLKGGNANKDIYGGIAANGSNGDVIENKVRIEGGTVTSPTGTIYGGYSEGNGAVKGNTVTITGGIMQTVYGGYSSGSGEVSGNTVNLGDGTDAMTPGYAINGKLLGGKNTTDANKVSNNTLNVNTNAKAYNIENFSTINFNFNAYTNTTQSLLTLTDTAKTKLQSLKQLHVKNAQVGKGTLMENTYGIDVAESGTVGRTEEKTETLIQKDGTTKIAYRTYQFKDSTVPDTDGTDVWGGRSLAGNATTGNNVTLNGNYSGNAYGGWTTKIATTVTGESEKNHSKGNRITLEGTTSQVQNMKGGATHVDGGDAAGNRAVLKAGKVNGHLTGGESVKGNATGNFVDISDGRVYGQTTGGAAGNAGKAEANEVTITGGTLNGDAFGGKTWDGDAAGNIVKLTGGTAEKVYGGYSQSAGKATGNTVHLSGSASTLDVYGGHSQSSDTEGNTVEISGGTARSVYGGESNGAGKTKGNTATLKSGSLTGDIFGGSAASGDAVENIVNITGGSAAGHDAYGGFSTNGNATGNTVNITGGSVRNVYGGKTTNGDATGNIVNVKGNGGTVTNIYGGRSEQGSATGNTVNLGDGSAAFTTGITGTIYGGGGMNGMKDYRTGNTLNVKGNVNAANISNFAEINFHFNSHVNQSNSFLTLSDAGGTTLNSLSDLKMNGEHGRKGTLLKNTHGITISDGNNRLVKTNENKELVLAKSSDNKQIDYEGYAFAYQTAPTTVAEGGTTNTWGGRSIGGNSTRHNTITVGSGTHTNIYGGWTAGSGTTAADKDNSYKNEVTLDGSSTTTDNLYGGYVDTDAGNAEENTVTVKNGTVNADVYGGITNKVAGTGYVKKNNVNISGGTVSNVYGGYSAGSGEVSGNTVTATGGTGFNDVRGGYSRNGAANENKVTLGAFNTGAITGGHGATAADGNEVTLTGTTVTGDVKGGEGATTKKNIVNLNGGVTINGALKGGTGTPGATGEENKLNVKGTNSAQSISNFQKLHFDTTGATAANPLLNITGGATNLDWNTLDASGTSVNRVSLLKNTAGINLSNHTPGTVKSKINEAGTTEYNIDVAKTGSTVTDITYQGYQFKGKTTATTEGTDTYGGRSKAGNTTTENDLTLDSGSHTNIYGGWTSGAGSTADAAKQKNSIGNKATVKGAATATGAVIGGLTDVAGGKATGNTVTVEKDLAANIIGGKAASGEASGNTVNLANATVNSVTGGDGTTTNDNTVNLNGSAQVTGALKGGSQASGTGNTLNVKGKNNKAGSIENIQKMNFDATGLAKDDTMLEDTNAAGTNVNWANLKASGTAAKPLTLLKNANGINLTGYMGAAKSETGETTETNIDVRKTGSTVTEITYEGYQFKGVTQATTVTEGAVTDTFGGRSKAGNSTRENTVEVASGTHTNVYGGWTSGSGSTAADKDTSYKNTVTVKGSANVTNTLYGGYTEAAGGKATENTVTVEKDLATANIIGGKAAAEASNNTVNLSNATVNSVTGGEGATTNNNIVNLKGNAQVTGALKGGSAANGTGNTLNVTGTNNKAGSISGFQKLTFDTTNTDANPMLQVTGGATTDVDWTTLTATGAASETPKTLMENATGINISGRTGDAVKSELNTDATIETNIDVVKSGSTVTKLVYEGYTVKGSTQATTYGADTWAGRSKAGNTTQDNTLTLDDASKTYTNVYGGWTSGTGTKAAADKQNNSLNNTVNYTAGTLTGTLYGGYAAAGEASGNTVNLGAVTSAANIYGGFGTVTKNNTINLKGARVTGTVTGGSAGGTGNTLAVYKPSEVHDFAGVQNLHFYTDEMSAGSATPMLKLGTATKDIRGLNIGVARSGAAPKLNKGDKILLMKTAGGALTTDAAIPNKVEGMQGVSRRYEYEIKQEATGELTATVTKAGFAEQAKSLVETRAGLAGFVNLGADYLVQNGLAAAQMSVSTGASGKSAQRKAAASDSASYHLWAGLGANSMRAESGSHVDSKGWNLGVGWAREDAKKDGTKVLFSPFVEYGHGTYDSYLDDGTHGSGKISYIGAGVLGKFTQKDGLWLEGSLRAGRAKSDYSANLSGTAANYDGSNTYYGVHLGAGKTFAVKEDSSIDAYARYFWSHQNSMTATLNTGDRYEFGSVNSQRLRLGLRYSLKDKKTGEFYAGLAWEHEFAGKAGATYEGDAAPSPSLKGSSYMLELGYRFMPANSRVSYDLHLNGWQGKRKGVTGGASVKWAF